MARASTRAGTRRITDRPAGHAATEDTARQTRTANQPGTVSGATPLLTRIVVEVSAPRTGGRAALAPITPINRGETYPPRPVVDPGWIDPTPRETPPEPITRAPRPTREHPAEATVVPAEEQHAA